jgi:hypothetical protein
MGAANPKLEASPQRASDPATNAVAFTGSADVDLTTYSRAVYVAADGDLRVDMIGGATGTGATVTFVGVKGGTVLPICIKKIYDTGTTVSGLILL